MSKEVMEHVLDYNQVGVIGRWFFQNRSVTPLFLVCLLVVLPSEVSWPTIARAGFLFLVFVAEGLRIWAVGYAGSATRTRGDSVPDLVIAGPYRWVRNPLYVANIVMYTAMGLFYGFLWLAGIVFVLSVTQYVLIVAYEEQTLAKTFGAKYDAFMAAVPRWFPLSSTAVAPTAHSFKLLRALRSERSTLLALFAMLAIWCIKETLVASLY